jgi:GNAT superfamily N-acetyltransferase
MRQVYKITLFQRPNAKPVNEMIVQGIYAIATSLTGQWFTANVPDDTVRDLIFHDVFCLFRDTEMISFLVFTGSDGMINISLIGTRLEFQGQGLGSKLIEHFFQHARTLGFEKASVWTVPEDVKPAYGPTLRFYEKHGFVITKRYTELWESGALLLEKKLG